MSGTSILRVCVGVTAVGIGGFVLNRKFRQKGYISQRNTMLVEELKKKVPRPSVPTREAMMTDLKSQKEYDILIIGGGATGSGIALDAATRGLSVALVEMDDFGSGTSSKSTKLIHGGVRYLEKAFRNLDIEQYNLVREALKERANLLKIAPHLSVELPIMLPIYSWWKLPYYYVGAKVYDLMAGNQALESSYILNRTKAIEKFPMLNPDGLKGAIVYYDGQHNDARMNISLILTAASEGAKVANHVKVLHLIKEKSQSNPSIDKVVGARVTDTLTGEEWDIRAKGVISAVGAMADVIRKMDNPDVREIVTPSSGVHVVLPSYYGPSNMGLLDPETTDDRLLFFLPWQGHVIVGTTDVNCEVTAEPKPTEKEISFILQEISAYLNPGIKVRRGDVLSAWSGLRPLVRDPSKPSSQELARTHIVEVSPSNLITVTGGKWTTYRSMAEDAVNKAVAVFDLNPKRGCVTETRLLVGAHKYQSLEFIRLVQQFGIEPGIAEHLCESYGDRAIDVLLMAERTGRRWPILGKQLSPQYPYIEAEVRYAVKVEYARTITDVIARRLRLSFLNAIVAKECIPNVADIMGPMLKWTTEERERQIRDAKRFLKTMGLSQDKSQFNHNQIVSLREAFDEVDLDKDGVLSDNEALYALRKLGHQIDIEELSRIPRSSDVECLEGFDFPGFLNAMATLEQSHGQPNIPRVSRIEMTSGEAGRSGTGGSM